MIKVYSSSIDDPRRVLELYASGIGVSTLSRMVMVKAHAIEKFIREQGVMRTREEGARLAMRRMRKVRE